ncbi:MAG: HipA domain-containing protein [Kiritimatiellae bacterium]|nr:HipA domain-containing protein [Kiritimatiellia bacterium]
MSSRAKVPDTLPFTKADLRLPVIARKGRRNSISGVQPKVLLSIVKGELAVVETGGDFILKPAPEDSRAKFLSDIPANEHLTMTIASRLFRIQTAENKCVRFADGELAYLTRRFDRRGGETLRQEDLCQIAGRSEETHGESYKYDFSYEEMADIIRMACPACRVELPKVFRQIVFDYIFANGDAHLKNFSVYESKLGDYVMTPAYDLLNTFLHYPGDPTFMALSLFGDPDFMTPEFEHLGYYSTPDFVALGRAYGLDDRAVCRILDEFKTNSKKVELMVRDSLLSEDAKKEYLCIFYDRLAMFR